MRAIDDHQVRFGELAGPLVHGAMFFDWQLVSTQELASEVEYSFQELVDADAIPYAPVGLDTAVHRYPTFHDTVSVEVTPTHVGDSSVGVVYEMIDGTGEPLSTAKMTHVTIAPEGGALAIPERAKTRLEALQEDRAVEVGPGDDSDNAAAHPTFERSFDIRSPHIEGSELAYFEEYPRFADIALESFLTEHAKPVSEFAGERQPFRLRDWHWEFKSPVLFDSRLSVESDVQSVTERTVRIGHTFRTAGEVRIEGVTEYGCFDRTGNPTTFTDEMLAPFEA